MMPEPNLDFDVEEPAYLTLIWDDRLEQWEMHTKMARDEIAAALSWTLMTMAAGEWGWDTAEDAAS